MLSWDGGGGEAWTLQEVLVQEVSVLGLVDCVPARSQMAKGMSASLYTPLDGEKGSGETEIGRQTDRNIYGPGRFIHF